MERTTEPLFTRDEVARRFGRSLRWVDSLIASGELGSYKIGRSRYVGETHIAALLEQSEQAS